MRLLLSLLVLVGCPSPDSPARQAVDAATSTPPAAVPASSAAPRVAAEIWTCPMHPEVTQDHAGTCPKCNMDLVKKGG